MEDIYLNTRNIDKKTKSLDKQDMNIYVIPITVNKFNNLKELLLNNNKLYLLPDSIGDLKKLQVLELNNNPLLKLPETIGNLNNLTSLSINNCRLTTIPSTFKNLSKLTILHILNNPFEYFNTDQNILIKQYPLGVTLLILERYNDKIQANQSSVNNNSLELTINSNVFDAHLDRNDPNFYLGCIYSALDYLRHIQKLKPSKNVIEFEKVVPYSVKNLTHKFSAPQTTKNALISHRPHRIISEFLHTLSQPTVFNQKILDMINNSETNLINQEIPRELKLIYKQMHGGKRKLTKRKKHKKKLRKTIKK